MLPDKGQLEDSTANRTRMRWGSFSPGQCARSFLGKDGHVSIPQGEILLGKFDAMLGY